MHQGLSALLLLSLTVLCFSADFKRCYSDLVKLLPLNSSDLPDLNGSIIALPYADPVYHGSIRGFRFNDEPEQRPLLLIQEGCENACGEDAELNGIVDAFGIMTTWVLPVIALLSQLPYESLSQDKVKNAEAFSNWIGSPAASLATTIWNILMIRKCQLLSMDKPVLKDTLFVLSCINQYQYERRPLDRGDDHRRDVALLRGILYPFVVSNEKLPSPLRQKLECLATHLAFQLRLQRRKGVYPLWLNLIWLILSFIFSIVTAFASLGDNTTAHSLALGLLLSWMPTVVLAAMIDRNPVSATRCGILIERWLYNVDALFAAEAVRRDSNVDSEIRVVPYPAPDHRLVMPDGPTDTSSDNDDIVMYDFRSPGVQRQDTEHLLSGDLGINTQQWHKSVSQQEMRDFRIGDFVGQGRRMRYCAVADTVLNLLLDRPKPQFDHLPGEFEAHAFRVMLPSRPKKWYAIWLASQLIVGMGYATAFVVSFQTPTIGLGCCTLAYTIWYLLSFFSWVFLGIWQEPPRLVRIFSWIPNGLACMALFGIMLLQTTGGLNRCVCKSSTFGTSYFGGYMDFENGEFYHRAFEVQKVWALATVFGVLSAASASSWFWLRWRRDSALWKVDEAYQPHVVEGLDMSWLI